MAEFVLPVRDPVRTFGAGESLRIPSAASEPASVEVAAPVQTLSFGEGEGKQPAPEYPRQAVLEGQEGVVVVRLSVHASGRVVSASAVVPSPWPLLNQAAVRVVRDRWRFTKGTSRLYDVAIRFQLTR
jgi:protein TonB